MLSSPGNRSGQMLAQCHHRLLEHRRTEQNRHCHRSHRRPHTRAHRFRCTHTHRAGRTYAIITMVVLGQSSSASHSMASQVEILHRSSVTRFPKLDSGLVTAFVDRIIPGWVYIGLTSMGSPSSRQPVKAINKGRLMRTIDNSTSKISSSWFLPYF